MISRTTYEKPMKTRLFSFHVFIDLFNKAKILSNKERRSVSSIINQALDEFLERKDV